MRASFILAAVVAVAAAASGSQVSACASDSFASAKCVDDAKGNIITKESNGCDSFAVCSINRDDPSACCKDDGGNGLTGSALDDCLFGYGVIMGGVGGGGLGGSNGSSSTPGTGGTISAGGGSSAGGAGGTKGAGGMDAGS